MWLLALGLEQHQFVSRADSGELLGSRDRDT